jgi:murein DD-endopeptidase MepM/ murein hydrolase activator NlpD
MMKFLALGSALFFFLAGLITYYYAPLNKAKAYFTLDFDGICNDIDYCDYGQSELDEHQLALIKNPSEKPDAELTKTSLVMFQDGDTLHSILSSKNVSSQEIFTLGAALKPYLRAKDISPGDLYNYDLLKIDNKSSIVKSFTIRKLDQNRVPITYIITRTSAESQNPNFNVELSAPEIREELSMVSLTVKGTLYRSFSELAFGTELMQRLMNVFAWRMKMPEEVMSNDKIDILVTKRFIADDFIGYGRIQSALYQQKQRTLFANYYKSKDGKISGFFDQLGKSLEKDFLISPVWETTATSNQRWRLHPVRNIRIRHNGTDYRGIIGTDFFSIADGTVIEKRFDRNVGNMIRIQHTYGIISEYFHADSLVNNIHVGSTVKRGQKIGEIGNTGILCTGPHLHLGLYKMAGEKKKFIDIKQVRKSLKDMPSLSGANLAGYLAEAEKALAQFKGNEAIALVKAQLSTAIK